MYALMYDGLAYQRQWLMHTPVREMSVYKVKL